MKTFFGILSVLAIATSFAQGEDLEWEPCNENNYGVGNIAVSPYPIPLVGGTDIDLSAVFDLEKALDGQADVSIKMVKKGLIDVPIPCIETTHGYHIGSCDYKLNDLVSKYADFLCPDYFPEDQDCAFPLLPGKYGGEIKAITLPDVPSDLAQLAKGTLHTTLKVNLDGEEVFCINGNLKLTA